MLAPFTPSQTAAPSIAHVEVLGYPVARCHLEEAVAWALQTAFNAAAPKLLVTLNPEMIVRAERDAALRDALHHADLTVADGVGVVWAARRAGVRLPGRIPGVELMTQLLTRGGPELRVYFLGARPGVAERAAAVAQARYGVAVAGVQHGFFDRSKEVEAVVRAVRESRAQLLLAGLGEGQELFLHAHRHELRVPLMIGVGGALDVLAGEVRRAPHWTHQLGLEWLWRVGSDPKRWHRFPRLVRFALLVQRGGLERHTPSG